MRPIDRAKAHFALHRRRQIEVPEWADEEGKPLIIYSDPLTMADKQKLRAYMDDQGEITALAQIIILKAKDAEGKPMFTLDDKHALMNKVSPEVLARISREITRAPREDELEKN